MNKSTFLEVIEVDPKAKYRGSVIWLHGLGADGSDFLGLIGMLGLPESHGLRFIFPSAPIIPITVNAGTRMRGWYDILDLNFNTREDQQGLMNARHWIEDLIQREMMLHSCSAKDVLLGGFSQGGALALYSGMRCNLPLGGIVALSTYQPMPHMLDDEISDSARNIPIFMGHGMFDPIVPFHHGEDAKKQMLKHSCDVRWHSYPIQHTVSDEEIDKIGSFVHEVFQIED